MREVTDHIVTGDSANHQLQIEVADDPGAGGASHEYLVLLPPPRHPQENTQTQNAFRISFQNGPIKEAGVNGLTQEALLAIVIDRLRCFQSGNFACKENETALALCEAALGTLQSRTRKRIARGVEGKNIQ